MTITDIQSARKGLSRLYIDGEYAVSLDTRALRENGISVGMEIDDEDFQELIEKCEYRRAKEKALWLLSGKDYSRVQLFDKLRKDVSEDTAEEVCERMEELGLIDDEKYARRLAHDLFYLKKLSYRGVVYKLMEKGIDKDLCEEIADEFDIDPVEQLVELIRDGIMCDMPEDEPEEMTESERMHMRMETETWAPAMGWELSAPVTREQLN